MKLPRRNFLHLAAGAVAMPAVSRIALAQTYPTRPVRIVVGFPAGGGADLAARMIGNGCQSGSVTHSSSRTDQERVATLLQRRLSVRRPTDTRF
jgi:hypothetical protein